MIARRRLVALIALLLASFPFGKPTFAASVQPMTTPTFATTSCAAGEVTELGTAIDATVGYLANVTDYFDAQLKGTRFAS